MVMFDLPVLTKQQRREATRYRKMLLEVGFSAVQLSVYSKYMVNATGLRSILPQIKNSVPPNGEVRVFRLTDEQWAATYRYFGPRDLSVEPIPEQLMLFTDDRLDEESEPF